MTRTGKIARLPHDIREEVNSRLHDGQQAKSMLPWLNSLPAVKSVLATHFNDSPINEVNLSDWKQGGYRDWLIRQDALELARDIDDPDLLGHQNLQSLCANLIQWTAVQYASLAKSIVFDEPDPKTKLARLRELSTNFTLLHRAQLAAERVAQEDFWIEREKEKASLALQDKLHHTKLVAKIYESLLPKPSAIAPTNQSGTSKSTTPPPQ